MEGWNTNSHKWKGIWVYKILKSISTTNNRAPKKKVIVAKDEDEKVEKFENKLVDGEVLHLITLKGKMELEFAKNAKTRYILSSSLKFFQL